jgi:hypothetical protein
MNQCEYCKKEFRSVSALNNHVKNAKYCLKLRNKQPVNDIVECPGCRLVFVKTSINQHQKVCIMTKDIVVKAIKELKLKLNGLLNDSRIEYEHKIEAMELRYDIEISEKDSMIAELLAENQDLKIKTFVKEEAANIYEKFATKTQRELIEIAKQPKTTNTTVNNLNINTPLSFDASDIHNGILSKFNGNTLIGGAKDLAALTIEYLTDDGGNLMYKCTDHSRGNFDYLDEEGNMVKDVGAIKLLESMFNAGLQSIVMKQGTSLSQNKGLPMVKVRGYQDQFAQDGEKGKRFSGAFRKYLANKTCIFEV